jgi:predicted GTPase
LDGGGAAEPWVEADLDLVVVDPLRAFDEECARRVRNAGAVVVGKADTAPASSLAETERRVRDERADVPLLLADFAVGVRPTNVLPDKRVVIVEDANSLVLGGLAAGAGAVAARRFRCGVVDPRPFAVGTIADALRRHSHIGAVIPSLGRTPQEIEDLRASVRSTPGDVVLWASNADPTTILVDESRPIVRAFGELTEVAGPSLQELLSPLL